jgi:hypothetical protein
MITKTWLVLCHCEVNKRNVGIVKGVKSGGFAKVQAIEVD